MRPGTEMSWWIGRIGARGFFKEMKTAKAPAGTVGSFGLWQFYYSTVTDFAKFLGLSTSRPLPREM